MNGAEIFEYRQKDLPPPPNYLVATPLELQDLLGFDDLIRQDQWQKLKPVLGMRQATGLNFNTMKPALIAALLEIDESAITPLIEARQQKPIRSVRQLSHCLAQSSISMRMEYVCCHRVLSEFLHGIKTADSVISLV